MAKVLILGGGFGGVVAAERLAALLSDEHQITLVSRSRNFVFYPALVRLAFGKCGKDDVRFDLRNTMLSRRINFVEADVAHVDPFEQKVSIAHGQVEGKLPYDYLIQVMDIVRSADIPDETAENGFVRVALFPAIAVGEAP